MKRRCCKTVFGSGCGHTILCLVMLLAAGAPALGASGTDRTVVDAFQADLSLAARGVPVGGALSVKGLSLDGLGVRDLGLERFRVFAPDAQIVAGGKTLAVPDNAYYRGAVNGMPGSRVVLSFHETGGIRGFVVAAEGVWVVEGFAGAPGLATREVDVEVELAGIPFHCETDGLPIVSEAAADLFSSAAEVAEAVSAYGYTARVAVETDWEYYNLFGNVTDATDYAGDIFAYASTIYEAEVDTSLYIGYFRLWPDGSGSDPWTTSDCSGALYEFRDYWNANMGSVNRSLTHMLSGKSTGCGIAYVGVLCYTSYAYSLSGALSGRFDINNPTSMWDIMVVSHEIGHNFSSPHTHCYGGIEGVADQVDHCYAGQCGSSGCWCGTQSLPCAAGGGNYCGTIMSYCHLLSGSYANISLTFGGVHDGSVVHPYGTAPDRVPRRMYQHASTRGSCMDPIFGGLTLEVTPTGTGGGTVTSDPAGIDCPSDCSETYPEGETPAVTLTATPDGSSSFQGWGGDCSGTEPSTLVFVDGNKSCTATFTTTCGNGQIDGGEECDGDDLGGATCGGCIGSPTCTSSCTVDHSSCFDGICEGTELCNTCPEDCTGSGAVCGNGKCEAGDGETCTSCATDCAGKVTGKPTNRYCCGFGDGYDPDGCGDSRCGGPASCTEDAGTSCCGDNQCTGNESSITCERDCGPPPECGDGVCEGGESCATCYADCSLRVESCTGGIDEDCDGLIDCDDTADCSEHPACGTTCGAVGDSCDTGSDCCSGLCHPKKKTCK